MARRKNKEALVNRTFYSKSYISDSGEKRISYIWTDTDEVAADMPAGEGFTTICNFQTEQKKIGVNAIFKLDHEKGDKNEGLGNLISAIGGKYEAKE